MKLSTKLILLTILFLAAAFRFNNIACDQGYHLHPDERAIIMAAEKLSPPQNLTQFFSPVSPWNPHFFAYGSLPFYLLYFVSNSLVLINPLFAHYDLINIPGRFLSGLSDLITIVVLFFLGKKLFNERIGLLAGFFYALSVLSIQLSHFYAVDTLLTLFSLTTLYLLIHFYEKPSLKKALVIGVFFGMALATKISALVLVVSIGTALAADFVLLFAKQPHKPQHYLPHLPKFIQYLLTYALIITGTTVATFFIVEPYALIDFPNFLLQTQQQSAMTNDAYTFPYTLQYVGKIPYLYELKNIFFFGLGPLLATFAFIGIFYICAVALKKDTKNKWAQETILLLFFLSYFLTVGKFAIGFMRYMLPIYPLLCLFAALFLYRTLHTFFAKTPKLQSSILAFILLILLIWPVSFSSIYSKNNTRVDATKWIQNNIPHGKMLLVEHWDDRLPIDHSEYYAIEDLELYNPDTPEKWQKIDDQLKRADYIIIASNRLYTPLQKLINCDQLRQDRCYRQTAMYYQKLFSGQFGFKKVAEFTNYPTIPLLNISITDQSADESFTVYDHPKVMIFKKQ